MILRVDWLSLGSPLQGACLLGIPCWSLACIFSALLVQIGVKPNAPIQASMPQWEVAGHIQKHMPCCLCCFLLLRHWTLEHYQVVQVLTHWSTKELGIAWSKYRCLSKLWQKHWLSFQPGVAPALAVLTAPDGLSWVVLRVDSPSCKMGSKITIPLLSCLQSSPSTAQICAVSVGMLNSFQLTFIWPGALSQERMGRIWRVPQSKVLVS